MLLIRMGQVSLGWHYKELRTLVEENPHDAAGKLSDHAGHRPARKPARKKKRRKP